MNYLFRILSLPLVLMFLALGWVKVAFYVSIDYVKHGGELTINNKKHNE